MAGLAGTGLGPRRRLRGGVEPAGVAGRGMAGAAGLNADGGGPGAQRREPVSSE